MPRLPTDYSKTIIYKLVKNDDLENENVYVGSTTDFTTRKYRHKSCCNNENSKIYNLKVYKSIRSNGGWSEWSMIEIEKYPCNDKNEALSRERYWYEFYNAKLNSNTMITTPEEKKEKVKQYRIDNVDKIKQKITCECGSVIRRDNKFHHAKSKRHINYMNSLEN
jgi:hypothetical protein